MRFDLEGNRISGRKVGLEDSREPVYWFEQENVNWNGFCDRPIVCENVTHLCSRFKGHGGSCAAVHMEQVAGRKVRRIEQE